VLRRRHPEDAAAQEQFLQHGVSLRRQRGRLQFFEDVPAIATEPAGAVAQLDPEKEPREEVRTGAVDLAAEAPADGGAAGDIARTVRRAAPLGELAQLRQRLRVVREIAVHGAGIIAPERQGAAQPVAISGAQPQLAGAVKHVHARVARRQRVRRFAGAVRRSVIHDQRAPVRPVREHRRHDLLDIRPLVVRRHHHDAIHRVPRVTLTGRFARPPADDDKGCARARQAADLSAKDIDMSPRKT